MARFGSLVRKCHFCQMEDEVVLVLCQHNNWLFLCEDCLKDGKIECSVSKNDPAPRVRTEDCPCYKIIAEKLMEKDAQNELCYD